MTLEKSRKERLMHRFQGLNQPELTTGYDMHLFRVATEVHLCNSGSSIATIHFRLCRLRKWEYWPRQPANIGDCQHQRIGALLLSHCNSYNGMWASGEGCYA